MGIPISHRIFIEEDKKIHLCKGCELEYYCSDFNHFNHFCEHGYHGLYNAFTCNHCLKS